MNDISFKRLDIALLVSAVIIIIFISIFFPLPLKPEYVPNAINGLTTLASILAGFTGFCMTYVYSTTKDIQTRNWLKGRVYPTALTISIGFIFIWVAYLSLVNGDLLSSFKLINIAFVLLACVFIDTFSLL
jgi:hypothetical protein